MVILVILVVSVVLVVLVARIFAGRVVVDGARPGCAYRALFQAEWVSTTVILWLNTGRDAHDGAEIPRTEKKLHEKRIDFCFWAMKLITRIL